MKERHIITIACIVAVLTGLILSLDCGVFTGTLQRTGSQNVLLIDPGHGGMDGGAVSDDGIMEKDINLAIANELCRGAAAAGWNVVMTRDSDRWLADTEEGSIRSRKTADLIARREIIRDTEPVLAVSIHLNSFKEDPSVCGAQVFYPDTGGHPEVLAAGRQLAQIIQQHMTESLDVKKERNAMAKHDVFLFKEVLCPVVIIECGFLSNQEEAKMLSNRAYQKKTAEAILAGITEFTGVGEGEDVRIIDSLR